MLLLRRISKITLNLNEKFTYQLINIANSSNRILYIKRYTNN